MGEGHTSSDAVVVGAGPNGLAAAITLARQGVSVHVVEAGATIGGGARTAELTEPGFHHDICSAIHPLGVASPFFRGLDLTPHGLTWVQPPVAVAHPLDDGTAVALHYGPNGIDTTADDLDPVDRRTYRRMMRTLVDREPAISASIGTPVPVPPHPLAMAILGGYILRGTAGLLFKGERANALMAGLCAHSVTRLRQPTAWAIGLYLGLLGHAVGWPMPRGGAQAVSNALADQLSALKGSIETNHKVHDIAEFESARALLLDVTPRQVLAMTHGETLPVGYRRRLERFRYGPGVFKMDWALEGPIPWRADVCRQAGTVHLGGTFDEVAHNEAAVMAGRHPDRPFVLLAQPTLFDPSRAPQGRHIAWAYCHVPNGSGRDMSDAIERQIERFAPGFRQLIRARSLMNCADMEAHNANYVGGDISGGSAELPQLLFRPMLRWNPWATPNRRIYLCSSSTPPGGGVHGMCGYNAATSAFQRVFR